MLLLCLEMKEMTTQEQKLIENPLFLKWVYHNNPWVEKHWRKFLAEHPEEQEAIMAFKAQLSDLKFLDELLSPSEKTQLAFNIKEQITHEIAKKRKLNVVYTFMKYAAVAILFFAIGGLQVYFFMNKQDKPIQVVELSEPIPASVKGPILITSKGENVHLLSSNSTLDYTRKGEIILNEDSIIKSTADKANALNQLVIPYGNQSKIVLSDNTIVWLNAGTRLLYPTTFIGKTREVILYGEGYFEVSKNKDMPFIVKTATMDVRVLGTEFNLSAYAEDNVVQTVLKEGSVAIRKKDAGLFDKDVIIKPNEMASFNKATSNTNIYKVDADYYRLWTKGLISFEDTDFKRVIKRVERFYNVSIRFEESSKEAIRISGKLDLKQSRQEVMEYLAKVSLSTIEQETENMYVIK